MKFRKLIFLWALLLVLSGCSHMVPVVPTTSAVAQGPKIQAEVGLILSDELKRFQVSESRMGDTWNFANLGQASAEHFRNYLESRFAKVTVVTEGSTPGTWTQQRLAAVFDPRIQSFTFDIPITKFQVYPASVRYSVAVYGFSGRDPVYKATVTGVGDTAGNPGFDFAANPSRSASRAVEEGVKASIEDVLANPAVKALLGAPGRSGTAKEL